MENYHTIFYYSEATLNTAYQQFFVIKDDINVNIITLRFFTEEMFEISILSLN